jgi:hypothetical protein
MKRVLILGLLIAAGWAACRADVRGCGPRGFHSGYARGPGCGCGCG